MASHTSEHWPEHLFLPGPAWERENRENWTKTGAQDAYARSASEAERRLTAYRGIETDREVVLELERIIRAGFVSQETLPAIPPLPSGELAAAGRGRRPNPRRAG